jgi:membrane protein YqaA with SNARE-associated domain
VYLRLALLIVGALVLNLLVLLIPSTWIEGVGRLGPLAYVAVFGITALANASVIVPIPYPGIVAKFASVLDAPVGVALAGAAGSTLGESTAFLVGRAGKGIIEDTRFYRWLERQLRTPLRAFIVLFLLSAPPNPFFDIAGLTAGSLGVSFPIFLSATFLGRIIKMLFFVGIGQQLLK